MKEGRNKEQHRMYPASALYVGDLSSAVHEGDLVQAFGRFPGFVTAKLCRDHISGNSLCYAYINFQTQPQAESAMRAMNHIELMGKPMRIMWIKRDPYSRKTGVGNLYVKNLEPLVSATDLERVFSQYGLVLSCKVVYDRSNGRSMQFGFVQMCSETTAQKAISALHDSNSTCLSKSLYVAKFVRKGCEKKNLYIKNLEGSITSKDLRINFAQYGQVASAIIMEDEKGNSKGFGFVSFVQSQDAERALSAMNGATWGSKAVYVGFAQKKAERGALLKQQFAGKEQQEIRTGGKKRYDLYVGNLEESVSAEDLRQLFESCGNVIFAKVVLDLNKCSRGFGFVYLSTLKGLLSALSMDGMSILKGRPIKVKRAYPKRSRNKYASTIKGTVPSPAATGALVQPFSCQVYPDVPLMMQGTHNTKPTEHNLWTSDVYAAPSLKCADTYSSHSISAPVCNYDPSMHCIQPQHTPASTWGMGSSHRALSLTPVTGAYSNSGKSAARAKTEDATKPRRPVVKFQRKAATCAELFKKSPIKTAVAV